MGVGISNWRLAQTVSRLGQLGVVSGTALDQVLARRLQDGDPGGHMRRAFDAFPFRGDGRARLEHATSSRAARPPRRRTTRLPDARARSAPGRWPKSCIVANFVEVYLAREGPRQSRSASTTSRRSRRRTCRRIYGAMLAGVDYVLMGAGIPLKIPGVLDASPTTSRRRIRCTWSARRRATTRRCTSTRATSSRATLPPLTRPRFLPIIASNTLAVTLLRKANGRVDGFIIEGPTAGGHNAPPRGKLTLNERGEPSTASATSSTSRRCASSGLPFWLAGGYGGAGRAAAGARAGAAGVQVGTAFAFCEESGLRDDYKQALLEQVGRGDGAASSPTRSRRRRVSRSRSSSSRARSPTRRCISARPRICDLGYLREAYRTPDGAIGFRCPSEPVSVYVVEGRRGRRTRRAASASATRSWPRPARRKRAPRARSWRPASCTSGDDLTGIARFMRPGSTSYTAADVIRVLLNQPEAR